MTLLRSKALISGIAQGLVVLSVASVFIFLGIWQLDRAAALKASLITATSVDKKVVPLESITEPNTTLNPGAINRMVNVSGRYVGLYKAPDQVDGLGKINDWEVALLQVGTHKGILVVRGLWSDRLLNPKIQDPMVVNITGQLLAHQDGDRAANSPGVISRLDSAVIVSLSDLDLIDGYILANTESHNGNEVSRVRLMPEKLVSRIPGFYWQHLSYVVIWWLMAGVVLYLPFYRRKVGT